MTEATVTAEHNQTMSDDQLRALAYHHTGIYKRELAKKKAQDAKFKVACKTAKADGVSVDRIKLLIQLDEEGGEEKLRTELQEKIETARWAGAEVGTQFDFLDEPDRTPLIERAREEGKIAGMKGDTCKAPYEGDAEQEWIAGWQQGQELLASSLDLTRARAVAEQAEAESEGDAPPKKRGRPKGSPNKKKKNGTAEAAPGDGDPFPEESGKPFREELSETIAQGEAAAKGA
jgi:ribosome modulation factor